LYGSRELNFKYSKMKNVFVILLLLLASFTSFSQDNKNYKLPEYVITAPELMVPIQGSGSGYLNEYLKTSIQYPVNSLAWEEEGVEIVKFVVTKNGEVTNLAVINSVSKEIDDEVFRVLNSTSGKWRPSMENGAPVEREKEVSIAFTADRSDPSDRFLRMAKMAFAAGNKKFYVKENYKSALYFYDKAVCYVPKDKSALLIRGMCKYQLGDKNGACKDWNRIKALGGVESDSFLNSFCEMSGYAEMVGLVGSK
jgi:hypothetical protein